MSKIIDENDIFDEDEFIGEDEFEEEDIFDEEDIDTDYDPEEDDYDEEADFDDDTETYRDLDPVNDSDEFTELDFDDDAQAPLEPAETAVKKYDPDDYTDDDFAEFEEETAGDESDITVTKLKKKGLGLFARIALVFLAIVVVFAGWTVGTKSGRTFALSIISRFIHSNAGTEEDPFIPILDETDDEGPTPEISGGELVVVDETGNIVKQEGVRSEDYVKTYLIFGIESVSVDDKGNVSYDRSSIGNTDAILLISVNTRDNTIKMTSILRDTYVDIPNWYPNKINSAYARGARGATTSKEAHENGAAMLTRVIEDTFKVDISGWACVNFNSFEKIVDRLGGIDIELGRKEASYLCTSNYISNPANRNVVEGWNHLNGNQVVGYCRVRHVPTLGGASNDYGRTVRHRRVINAIINKYKSSGITELLPILKDVIGYVYTNVSEEEMTKVMSMVIENKIFTTNSLRIPVDEGFYDSGTKGINNGNTNVKYTLVMGDNIDKNIKALHQFIFLDEDEPETEESEISPTLTSAEEK